MKEIKAHLFWFLARPTKKIQSEARKQAGKKKGGLSVIPTRNFCPPALPAEGGLGWEAFPQFLR
jgi:hypothetical protein